MPKTPAKNPIDGVPAAVGFQVLIDDLYDILAGRDDEDDPDEIIDSAIEKLEPYVSAEVLERFQDSDDDDDDDDDIVDDDGEDEEEDED